MRYWLLAVGIFFSTLLHAQFGFYVEGGPNYSMIRATRSPGTVDGKGALGGQLGVGIEYHFMNDFFMYMGVGLSNQTFKKDSASAGDTVISKYNFNPYFVNVPFGFGYQFNFTKSIGLKVYGGINTQIGAFGTVKRTTTYNSTGNGGRIEMNKHDINYGRSKNLQNEFQSDLNNTIWGLNVGAGLNFSKAVEIVAFYQEGLTNILPGGDGASEVNKLRSVSLGIRFYFPRNYYHSGYKE